MRTNIDIDDGLLANAMAVSENTTKKAVVEEALRVMVQLKSQEALRNLRGKIVWRGHDDDWFVRDEEILEKRRLAEAGSRANEASTTPNRLAGSGTGRQR